MPTWPISPPRRAGRSELYDLLVIPGAEITQNHIRSKKNSHIVALNIREHISADQPAEDILQEIRRQGAVSIACHPHHRTTDAAGNRDLLPLGTPQAGRRAWSMCGKRRIATICFP